MPSGFLFSCFKQMHKSKKQTKLNKKIFAASIKQITHAIEIALSVILHPNAANNPSMNKLNNVQPLSKKIAQNYMIVVTTTIVNKKVK